MDAIEVAQKTSISNPEKIMYVLNQILLSICLFYVFIYFCVYLYVGCKEAF